MVEFPEKINFGETLSLYKGRKPEPKEQPDIEKLDFDRKAVQTKMDEMTSKVLTSYRAVDRDSEGTIVDRPEVWKKRVPILAEVVDDTIPLTLFAMKTFSLDRDSEQEAETISFDLVRGRVESDKSDDLYKVWKSSFSAGNHISGLEFVDKGDLFDLADRETNMKFRGQGFGSMVLKASEGFIHESATEKQKAATAYADAAQLDVICWLYNSGYCPQTDEDTRRLGDVLAGDSGITIGEKSYIFKDVPEESRVIQLPDGGTVPNRHNAYRIKFIKEIPPKTSPDVADVQGKTHDLIEGV